MNEMRFKVVGYRDGKVWCDSYPMTLAEAVTVLKQMLSADKSMMTNYTVEEVER